MKHFLILFQTLFVLSALTASGLACSSTRSGEPCNSAECQECGACEAARDACSAAGGWTSFSNGDMCSFTCGGGQCFPSPPTCFTQQAAPGADECMGKASRKGCSASFAAVRAGLDYPKTSGGGGAEDDKKEKDEEDGLPTGAIIGIAVGSLAVVGIAVVALCMVNKRQRAQGHAYEVKSGAQVAGVEMGAVAVQHPKFNAANSSVSQI